MIEIFTRVWENFVARTEGPMDLRFFIQPAMSLMFAIRAGIRDAKNGTAPYLWRMASSAGERKGIAREAWKHVGKVFIIAVILDVIYQLIVVYKLKTEEQFYPLESLLVSFSLAILPYIIFRGPVSRLIKLFAKNKSVGKGDPK